MLKSRMGEQKTLDYIPRLIDAQLQKRLGSAGAVVLEGAKGTGKTETARQLAQSAAYLDTDEHIRQLLEVDPKLVLAGEKPRLLDEWQVAPQLWNYVRRAVDDSHQYGEFILTGSAQPLDNQTRHSGAGRFSRLRMRPFTLLELGEAKVAVSLADLFSGRPVQSTTPQGDLEKIVERMVHGGYPGALHLSLPDAIQFNRDYLDQISRVSISEGDRLDHDPRRVLVLLHAVARNVATEVSVSTLAKDSSNIGFNLAHNTIARYLDSLSRIFILEEQPAWAPAIRSRARLRSAPKYHLADVALAIAGVGAGVEQLFADLNTLGLMFESFVFQHLVVYGAINNVTVHHYRDSNGLEADAILQRLDGSWIAIEVKLGIGQINQAAESLLKLRDLVKGKPPAALVVIVPHGYAYKRPDGVSVVPLTLLGP